MRKICVVVTNRSDYGRLKPIMVALKARPDVALQVVIGAHVYTASIISHIRHAEPASLRKSLPWYIRACLQRKGGEVLFVPADHPAQEEIRD